MIPHLPMSPHPCPDCTLQFPTPHALRRHVRLDHRPAPDDAAWTTGLPVVPARETTPGPRAGLGAGLGRAPGPGGSVPAAWEPRAVLACSCIAVLYGLHLLGVSASRLVTAALLTVAVVAGATLRSWARAEVERQERHDP